MLKRRSKIESFRTALNMLAMSGLVIFIFCIAERPANAQGHSADNPSAIEDHGDSAVVASITVKETTPVATVPALSPESLSKDKRTKTMIKIIFQLGLETRKVEAPAV